MRALTRIGAVSAASIALVGAFGSAAQAATPSASAVAAHASFSAHGSSSGAVFVETDSTVGNAVVAYRRAADGTLTQSGRYATGGVGGVLGGSVVDHTASEGAVARSEGDLLTVNAGSDTVTSFRVDGDRLARVSSVSSGGDFPVSIATRGAYVFVLNARDGGSVQGYLNLGGRLVALPGSHRALGLDPAATPEFTTTPAQVSFTPDGSHLVVSTKGNTSAFEVFGVRGLLGLSAKPVTTTVAGAVPFGFTFDARGRIVATEAGPNAVATFAVQPSGAVTPVSQTLTGQAATCWIVEADGRFYASNAGSGTLSTIAETASGQVSVQATTATDAGTVDAAATPDGRYVYAQTGATGTLDEFRVGADGSLVRIGSVVVPDAVGGEGIVAE
ncbi:lactonase family protein [Frondihabitans australicus]|uniref:6-phosphogluconolactonase (Cycloisomerase 2 family) n=1 Tax=Frondihabitans australicus TaxID=386892 RepID=A0A495IC02_9MICO|nr:beta-propeller fold lactonase family protein [Frondihabitans australicus]RKR73524.1 6-phosphogluconolactonase (cycloisomerase 2 family) [Frondihabitans australicus]